MAFAKAFKVAVTGGGPGSGTTLTSGTFDATGFDYIVVFFKYEGGAAVTQTPSDSATSTGWNSETQISHSGGEPHGQFHWVRIGGTGASATHTVTTTIPSARSYRGMAVWVVDTDGAVLEKDAVAGAFGTGVIADAGTLSTTGVSVVSFMGVAEYATGTWTPSTGWPNPEDVDGIGGAVATYGNSRGPETTSPIDPAATFTISDRWTACSLSLRLQAGGHTIAVGLASETDSVFAMGRAKVKAIGLNTETDSVLAMTRKKTRAIGLNTETDSSLAMTFKKAKAIGLNTETDTAFQILRSGHIFPIGQPEETDAAFSMGKAKLKAIGLSTETDSALAATRVKAKAIGQVTETDTAFSFTHAKRLAIGLAEEVDSALRILSSAISSVVLDAFRILLRRR